MLLGLCAPKFRYRSPSLSSGLQRRAAANRRASIAPLKKEMQTAEKAVEHNADEIAKLDKFLADPTLYERDAAGAQAASVERGRMAKRLAEAEEAWLAASEAYERATHRSFNAQ